MWESQQWSEHRMFLNLARNLTPLAVDTESAGLRGRLLGISLAINPTVGLYYPFGHAWNDNCPEDIQKELQEVLETHDCLIFHNAKHDVEVLERHGFKLNHNYRCTLQMYHFVHENYPKDLSSVSRHYGGEPKQRPSAMQKAIDAGGWGSLPYELTKDYATHDALITFGVDEKLKPEFDAEFKPDLWAVEQDFIDVMRNIERVGILIDRPMCQRQALTGRELMLELEDDLGWNPGSTNQLGNYLINTLNLPVIKLTPKGKPSFDKLALEEYDIILESLDNPVAKTILRYRGWQKTVTSNYEPYLTLADEDDVLHPNFKLHGTKTGRMSCEKPNLQQIPRHTSKEWNGDLKQAFIPRPGKYLLDVDYSQLELRLAAAYSKEEALIEIFNEGRDVFSEMAAQLDWERYAVKTFTYATLYGAGIRRIKNIFGVTEDEARDMRSQFFQTYKSLKKVSDHAARLAKEDRYLEYWTGRRRHFLNPKEEAHKAFNSLIQGGAFEIVKRAMIRLHKRVPDATMVLQVHDSVVFEIDEGVDLTQRIIDEMTMIPEDFGVPFVVEAKKWGS